MSLSPLEDAILAGANRIRLRHGLAALDADAVLAAAGRAHARDMADHAFFSHGSAVEGRETLAGRVREAGGDFRGVGENIARIPEAGATAEAFLDGWMESPGHRENLLRPEWDRSGVAVARSADGQLFAAQLFGLSMPLQVQRVDLRSRPLRWLELRVSLSVGPGISIGTFVQNRFASARECAADGRVEVTVDVPHMPGSCHVALGKRPGGGDGAWIGVYDGFVEQGDHGVRWRPAGEPMGGAVVHAVELFEVSGSELVAGFAGEAREPAVVVVNGVLETDVARGPYAVSVARRAGSGRFHVEIGAMAGEDRYLRCRSYSLDTDAGTLEPVET